MLRSVVLLLALSIASLPALQAQAPAGSWSMLEASPFHGYRFEDGHFIDPQTGWVVNPAGEVWKTQDGGATWDLASVHPSEYIRSVAFLSEEVGFFGTLYGGQALYRTTDGGETFEGVTGSIQVQGPARVWRPVLQPLPASTSCAWRRRSSRTCGA